MRLACATKRFKSGRRTWFEAVITAKTLGTVAFACIVIAAGELSALVGGKETVEAARNVVSLGVMVAIPTAVRSASSGFDEVAKGEMELTREGSCRDDRQAASAELAAYRRWNSCAGPWRVLEDTPGPR